MKNEVNIQLIIGILLFTFFIVIALIGPFLAPYDLEHSKKIDYIINSNGEGQLRASPFPPSKEHIFGTDKWGYDVLTLMLYGAKYTIFTVLLVAFVRVMIGTTLGIFRGLKSQQSTYKRPKRISLFSGIPVFIIIYFIMVGINIEPVLSPTSLVIIQATFMILLGIPGVFNVIFSKTLEIKKKAFVEAARTLGGSKLHISLKHIFPALKVNLLTIFFSECIQVLHIIGQLGIFNLFLGGTEKQYLPTIYLSITNEWAGLIGQSRSFLYNAQWVVIFPLLAYLLFLFSLYAISSGIGKNMKNDRRRTNYI
ncbi:peptide/nickel transport system permease protein [Cytobacillus eiseniae]|uniref:Peptide/nickel transport system permease protein n=1 Tax=Cytobacillus eiseniae TaxID=762947 RepID=A0ABS4RFN0_9BACI|nr:ABC transporter permease subunit [Cytobacillus eiseniae]MBP2241713.1 peptide/nickel transport system permease protein [Cytobacillus eiseniae]